MKMVIAIVMLVAIAGLWQYNQKVSAQSEKAKIAAQSHKPFQPVGSHPIRSSPVATQSIASPPISRTVTTPHSTVYPYAPSAPSAPAVAQFTCDGRTHCSQMRSCEEATYFIQHCPNTKMDGNHDGVPCEKQWCN